MGKILVTYFSASGITAKAAAKLASVAGADTFEIRPAVPYTKADLNWKDMESRSSIEMKDKSSRPAIAETCANIADYDTVFVGFPVWWHIAPTIVNTFLESCDLKGKTVIPFATSGSTGLGRTNDFLQPSIPESTLLEGRIVTKATEEELADWLKELGLK